ncbi:hypothetical protein BDZ91DRAFT_763132 [Kalaharituber pfeilii]|nr:hypothetical protein BDZ91DRAFT_763132 [Kalaharituber pfeilii]
MDLLDLDTLFNEDLPMLLGQFPGLWEADVGGKAVSSTGAEDHADPASSISHKGEDDLTQDSEAETSQDLDELFYEDDDERTSMGNDAELGEAVSAQEARASAIAAANSCAPAGTVNPAAGVPGTQSTPSAPAWPRAASSMDTPSHWPADHEWRSDCQHRHLASPKRTCPKPVSAKPSASRPARPPPVTEQSAAPSPSTRSAKKGPAAKTPRPRARADESSKVTKKPTRAPPKRPATPPSLVTNTPSEPSSTITTPHSLGEIVPPGPPTPKKKSFKGRGPCKGRDWSIRPEQQDANGPGMGLLAAERPAPPVQWMPAEIQMASGSQAPAPPQQQFQQPAPQAYPSLPVGMQMGANWAPPPEEAQQPQLLAAPNHGYAWAGIWPDVPAPVQEPLSDYDATIARQLASQMAWFPQDASEEFDASYELAPEESRLFLKPRL